MTTDLSPSGIQRLLEICDSAAKAPWSLCHHLKSAENDAACPCGYRGGIYGGDGDHMVCEMGSARTAGQEGLEPPGYERGVELANAAFIATARTALPDALRELSASRDRIAALEAAIQWALGEGDSNFGDNKPANLGPYWWRIELKRRAVLSGGVGT